MGIHQCSTTHFFLEHYHKAELSILALRVIPATVFDVLSGSQAHTRTHAHTHTHTYI